MKVQVVAAVIIKGNRFLLGKRALSKKSAPGFWCPISGRIEIGLEVKPIRKLAEFDTHDRSARIHWWLVDVVSGEPTLKNDEHTELCWFSVPEMENLENIFSEDIELFKTLL